MFHSNLRKNLAFVALLLLCFVVGYGLTKTAKHVKENGVEAFKNQVALGLSRSTEKAVEAFKQEALAENPSTQTPQENEKASLPTKSKAQGQVKISHQENPLKTEIKKSLKKEMKKLNLGSLKLDSETAASDPIATKNLRDALQDNEDEHSGATQKLDSKNFEKSTN
jgi:hypothetical protein